MSKKPPEKKGGGKTGAGKKKSAAEDAGKQATGDRQQATGGGSSPEMAGHLSIIGTSAFDPLQPSLSQIGQMQEAPHAGLRCLRSRRQQYRAPKYRSQKPFFAFGMTDTPNVTPTFETRGVHWGLQAKRPDAAKPLQALSPTVNSISPTPSTRPVIRSPETTAPTPSGVPV